MVLGIGVDIVEIARIAKALENPRFIARVFSSAEQEYCWGKGRQAAASFAARFAAKEAVGKALGTGIGTRKLTHIEVAVDRTGKPMLILSGAYLAEAERQGAAKLLISLTHSREYAVAQVVMVGG